MNNPYLTEPPSPLCPNVCGQLSWVDWDLEDFDSGFMSCCEVRALRDTIEYLPDLRDGDGNWPGLLSDTVP